MELRWRSPVSPALVLLLGLLLTWAFVAAAASTPGGVASPKLQVPAFVEDLLSPADDSIVERQSAVPEAAPVSAEASERQGLRPDPAMAAHRPAVSELSREFVGELSGVGLRVSRNGDRVLAQNAGIGTARQLVLAQAAADRFGITENPFFDPARVAVIRDGKALADLSTGVLMGHEMSSGMFGTTEVIGADLLEELRNTAGWSITSARRAEAALYRKVFGYVPVYLQSDEAFAIYKESARVNYVTLAAAG